MRAVLILLVTGPLLAALACLRLPPRRAQAVTIVSGAASLLGALALVPGVDRHTPAVGFLRADALSVVFVLATAFCYATTAVHSVGYLRSEQGTAEAPRYARRFYVGLNLFCWAMLAAPLVNGLALLWIAIEVTTVISALLVAIDDTEGATEASWKYVLIASVGLGIALLATIFMYYAGSQLLGGGYDLAFGPLVRVAHALPAQPVRLAYVLAVVGFGTKAGLVPMHTWLPDAHAEAPTPVSALLSGALLADSFYAVLRYHQVAVRTLGPAFPDAVLLAFGLASLVLAALYVLDQRDIKRLLAYSSVEHMGILAIGVSFGTPVALAGVLLQVLAHAAAKATAFFGAGALLRGYGTKDIEEIHAAADRMPVTGVLFVTAVLALSALPPFGIFRSEFQIVSGGLAAGHDAPAAVLVALVTVAFLGLSLAATRMVLQPGPAGEPAWPGDGPGSPARRGEPSWWMVTAMAVGIGALLVLGVHPPGALTRLLHTAALALGGGT
ncbi:MAG TPA: proton-conducting transporter membrane subunit [Mycobacteriales bacterium]|nr:proton-conducting transporter membrane subunit [Mycobacteriales bacterium]